jgi:hypothetical protein
MAVPSSLNEVATPAAFIPSPMKKKQDGLEGTLEEFPENQIFLNINYLEDGQYRLNIMHRNKIIKQTTFKKKKLE